MPKTKYLILFTLLLVGCSKEEIVCEKVVDDDHFFITLEKEYDDLLSLRQKEVYHLPKNLNEEVLKELDAYYIDDARYFRMGHTISFYQEYHPEKGYSARLTEFDLYKRGYHCETP